MSNPKVIIPRWVRKELNRLGDDLSGDHAEVFVTMGCLCGPGGFDVKAREEAIEIDPEKYGPVMQQAYSFIAGGALMKMAGVWLAMVQHDDENGNHGFRTEEEKLEHYRNTFDQGFRMFLAEIIEYAITSMQATAEPTPQLIAMSQVAAKWIAISHAELRPEQGNPEADSNG